ncbi:hypothetical protein [Butyrivibrio sp. NC2002]|uniref:hypothetical protein n=1 Tax=Butyrivibrio sp. NC2002 TaxID=1410610 RepID=UPI00055AFFC8|nr:hypothetical protein [Butyrivibrio sp. NC2002]
MDKKTIDEMVNEFLANTKMTDSAGNKTRVPRVPKRLSNTVDEDNSFTTSAIYKKANGKGKLKISVCIEER